MISGYKFKVYDRVLGTISALAIICGGFWTVNSYWQEKKEQSLQQAEKTKQLKRQIDIEIFNQKKDIYYELCASEAEIAACNNYKEVLTAQKHFLTMFYGKAHIIAGLAELDYAVLKQKVAFWDTLYYYQHDKYHKKEPYQVFGQLALNLDSICSRILDIRTAYKKE